MNPASRDLIVLEAETLDELRDAVNQAAVQAAGLLALKGSSRRELIAIIQQIAEQMQEDLTTILIEKRDRASQLAMQYVQIEAEVEDLDEPDDEESRARSYAAAAAFVAAWILIALAAKKSNIVRNTKLQDYRLKRIAATEIVDAYAQSAAKLQKQLPVTMTKRWDATLDRRTCEECAALHGTEISVHDEFPEGDPPLHPQCRCIVSVVAKEAREAA